ncbi:MAG TPA: Rieske 2Fe-2S domain-containing protein [Gaiellaceae bacterium]|nr:Rieske 2Fe-2S domain-containing protein [Gaiellaceae bacterium]
MQPSREHRPSARPSLWPWTFALGVVLVLVGIVVSWILVAVGAVVAVAAGFAWVRGLAGAGTLLRTGEVEPERRVEAPQEDGYVPPRPERFPRSVFLELSTLGLGGVIGGLVTVPALGFMVLPPFLKQKFKSQDVGPVTDFPEGTWVVTTFMADPAQGEVSRKTAFVRNNGMLGQYPSFTVISNHCAHLGCPVQPNGPLLGKGSPFGDEQKQYKDVTLIPALNVAGFGCPCHGGAYDTEGNRTAGPPVRALDRYSFSIRDGHLFLGAPFSVSFVEGTGAQAKIHKWSLAFPGEHVHGIESWLYPIQAPH